jgi:putative NADH-flavin reductase
MNIGVIGATGNIGRRIVAEALSRGHQVIAFGRHKSPLDERQANLTWKVLDVFDTESVARGINGLDVLVNSYGPGNAARDLANTIEQSIRNPEAFVQAAKALLKALEKHPRIRLIVVGGAGSLEVEPGLTRADSPNDLRESMKLLGLPEAYEVAVRGHRDALNVYRTSNRLWTYLSPAEQIYPGERTGRFRLGGDQPVLDSNGKSRISFEDYAIALVDEAELPRHVQRRFTVGY